MEDFLNKDFVVYPEKIHSSKLIEESMWKWRSDS